MPCRNGLMIYYLSQLALYRTAETGLKAVKREEQKQQQREMFGKKALSLTAHKFLQMHW